MRRTGLLFSLIVLACLGVLASWPAAAADGGAKSPEDAIAAYIGAVARQDFDAVVAASYADHFSKGADFVAVLSRGRSMSPILPMPSKEPFFAAINRADAVAKVAGSVKGFVYGLLVSTKVAVSTFMVDETETQTFAAALQQRRLSGLSVVKVGVPNPTRLNNKFNQSNWDKRAHVLGADAQTERVALLSFEGKDYALGFGLMRYGEDWLVSYLGTEILPDTPLPVPMEMTPEAFEALLK